MLPSRFDVFEIRNTIMLIVIAVNHVLFAQDSTRTFKLDEITVSGSEIINPKPITVVNQKLIEIADAKSVAGLSKFIPSLKLQVNSRGESQIFLRGYGVRQLALFFDGVPLTVPWDNRIDLSLVPTNALGSVVISNGIPSVLYGANTLGGVIALKSITPDTMQRTGNLYYIFGSNNTHDVKLNYSGVSNCLSYLLSFGYEKSDDYTLPSSIKEFYNGSAKRLNSNFQRLSGFGKLAYRFSEFSNILISASIIDAKKGVPPEFDVGKPRFWKYPLWRKATFIINGKQQLLNSFHNLEYAFSVSGFEMNIEQYTGPSYSILDDKENNRDLTFYGRAVYSYFLAYSSTIKFAVSGINSTHRESFLSAPGLKTYSQNIFSVSSEYEYHLPGYSFLLGLNFDNQNTPETGGKPKRSSESKLNFKTQLTHFFSDILSSQFSFGKKSRFPTLRELYSGALGRFIPNPNLKSEDVYTLETNLKFGGKTASLDFSAFYSILFNGIQRISLPGKQFKRVNKNKIRTLGTEFSSKLTVNKNINVSFNISYLNSFAENEIGEFSDTLEYKPGIIAGGQIEYSPFENFTLYLEANFTGEEFGLKEGTEYFQKLPSYAVFNFRISYFFEIYGFTGMQTFVRVNNLFDKLYYTQWGLPERGREILLGLNIKY